MPQKNLDEWMGGSREEEEQEEDPHQDVHEEIEKVEGLSGKKLIDELDHLKEKIRGNWPRRVNYALRIRALKELKSGIEELSLSEEGKDVQKKIEEIIGKIEDKIEILTPEGRDEKMLFGS